MKKFFHAEFFFSFTVEKAPGFFLQKEGGKLTVLAIDLLF